MSVGHTGITSQVSPPAPVGPCGEGDCGIRDVLDRIGDRWTVLVLVELSKGVRRFRELQRAIPGISQRMLTLTTRRLCRDGLVERTAYPTIPPQVDYRLTAVGRSLADTVFGLADWSAAHKDTIAAARQRWDAEHPSGQPD
ncbi:helix-turn-helix transcriptional regulator [Plantactinospora sp. S1510]|uniref:Helix-turn-helix transcriptional regulator n=1 Tax=Plantactinospora alkalitolerans TaxID=2789879 RepID=A0ABS0H3T2_9ACTN|nr:helix-turn-helix domain-containing protein [Plantactinospora alkalitolerans]MBF9133123.1 helix-turn-helix transcriptional regulator [Plantactinospora alkalitolerans]